MQSETALSTMEAEFIALSEGMWTTIPIMNLIDAIREEKISMVNWSAVVNSKVFEDNSCAKTLATTPKYRPRTKHINNKYWHFRDIELVNFEIQSVKSEDQLTDILTKTLSEREFVKLRDIILGEKPGIDSSALQGSAMNKEPGIVATDFQGRAINLKKTVNKPNAWRCVKKSARRTTRRIWSTKIKDKEANLRKRQNSGEIY